MAVRWTSEQKKVIDLRNRNILVAAAAGSGKTAVLVERIVEKVCDAKNPVDIDRLLVVTFTKAAAAEMRERVAEALQRKAALHPEEERFARQKLLAEHAAQITTIDSFCMYLLRNHFQEIGLDPSFRVADEGELALLKADVLEDYLETQYQECSDAFRSFADSYCSVKGDSALEKLILEFYTLSQSYPWPEEWILACEESYRPDSEEALEKSAWMEFLTENAREMLADFVRTYERILQICAAENGPALYLEKFRMEKERLEALAEMDTYRALQQGLSQKIFETKPRKKKTDVFDERLAERASGLRENVRKEWGDLKKKYFALPPERVLEELAGCREAVKELCRLTLEFSRRYAAEKRRKNLVDFGDLEHLALEVLLRKTEKGRVPSATAQAYSEYYEEIMIDEYQDSNQVQEVLLNSISRERMGTPNVFMVGDVKQSIYKFRLARPELFMEKYASYGEEDGDYQKIELRKNFRSRKAVLDGVNFLFYQIMQPVMGGVAYTQEAALYPGAVYEALPEGEKEPARVRLCLAEAESGEKEEDMGEEAGVREWEARMAAAQIRKMTEEKEGALVWDKEEGRYRRAGYGDIVILLRTVSGWAETFVDVLGRNGIPAYAESQQGYFETTEVQTALNLLRVIDNPMQDIPLAAVLRAPFGGCSSGDLAEIGAFFRTQPQKEREKDSGKGFYAAVKSYAERGRNKELSGRLASLLKMLEDFRLQASYLPLSELLQEILEKTGYARYAAAMPMGKRRRANLEILAVRAENFEKTSYRGIFHFIRYVERLQKYEIDYGETPAAGGGQAVRIMSVHKSKGLEFPIVILSGLGKQFNQQDARQRVVFHPDLGAGLDLVNGERRTRRTTLLKRVFQRKLLTESLGEETRVLYVALTRAKEYLVMTGVEKNLWEKMKKRVESTERSGTVFHYGELARARNYLDWVLPALYRHRDFKAVSEELGLAGELAGPLYQDESSFEIQIFSREELLEEERTFQTDRGKQFAAQKGPSGQKEAEETSRLEKEAEKAFAQRYRWEDSQGLPATMSVSELKRASMEPEEGTAALYGGLGQKEKKNTEAAERGTAWHHVLELLPLGTLPDENKRSWLRSAFSELEELGKLSQRERELVDLKELAQFLESPLCGRMARADRAGLLKREEQFVIGIPAGQIKPLSEPEERLVMVQGVIDAWFEEDGKLILVDYKTDRLPKNGGEEILFRRYEKQLDYYGQALSMATGLAVGERYLYSFSLGKAVKA